MSHWNQTNQELIMKTSNIIAAAAVALFAAAGAQAETYEGVQPRVEPTAAPKSNAQAVVAAQRQPVRRRRVLARQRRR